jgi:hypothetical protein
MAVTKAAQFDISFGFGLTLRIRRGYLPSPESGLLYAIYLL